MVNVYTALLIAALSPFSAVVSGAQSQEIALYEKAKLVHIFESNRQDIESWFAYTSSKESGLGRFSKTVYYEMKGATLEVYYSNGRCAEHNSKIGFNVDRDIVIGVDLFFHKDVPYSRFGIDLNKFRKHKESDNDAIIYNNEAMGVELTGTKKKLSSIEWSGTESEQEKYRCN